MTCPALPTEAFASVLVGLLQRVCSFASHERVRTGAVLAVCSFMRSPLATVAIKWPFPLADTWEISFSFSCKALEQQPAPECNRRWRNMQKRLSKEKVELPTAEMIQSGRVTA